MTVPRLPPPGAPAPPQKVGAKSIGYATFGSSAPVARYFQLRQVRQSAAPNGNVLKGAAHGGEAIDFQVAREHAVFKTVRPEVGCLYREREQLTGADGSRLMSQQQNGVGVRSADLLRS